MLPLEALRKYAPRVDGNDPVQYAQALDDSGVDMNKPISEQLETVAKGIEQHEGWKPGFVTTWKKMGGPLLPDFFLD